jgi:two-component system, NtrC family, sensor kinase
MGEGVKKKAGLVNTESSTAHRQDLERLLEVVSRGKYMWESTFDAIGDPVMIVNDRYQIERANRAAAKAADIDVRHMIGKTCYQLLAKRDKVCPGCPLQQTLDGLEPHPVTIEKFTDDKVFQVSSYPLNYQVTEHNAVVHHYRDVTEERKLHRMIAQTEKMAALGMLAGGVAHEINNPLSGILAFTQLLQRDLTSDSPMQDDLKEIESAALRCKAIVENLLNFSRQTKSSDRSPIDINKTIEAILPLFRLKLKLMQVEVETFYADNLEPVFGNAAQIQQIVLNLIGNAADAMSEGGVVKLTTEKDARNKVVEIKVNDTGMGIKPDHINNIFDPYFTTKTVGNGTGLGLSISYNIIQEHQGDIKVESQVGKGTTFTICLPIYDGDESDKEIS